MFPFIIATQLARRRRTIHLFAYISAALLLGCGQGPPPGGFASGPTPVNIVTVQPETIPVAFEYTAQTLGSREVEIRARVTGILMSRNYTEGQIVKAQHSLFTIDPEPFVAALDRAHADLAAAEARLEQAKRDVARLKPLAATRAVSQQEYDDALSNQSIYSADVAAAKARLKQDKLNLDWTKVETPITGVASRALQSEGSLISGPDVLLTTVTQVDPMHILFGISDNEQLKMRSEVKQGRLKWPAGGNFQVSIRMADGSEYATQGVMDFRDIRVNNSTGTSEARAEVPNPQMILQPGQFVRVRLIGAERHGAFKVPQRAVQHGAQGKFVYVVDADNKAAIRPVEVGEWTGDSWVITNGLQANDRVITDGTLKLGPGAPVMIGDPPATPPAGAAPAGH